MAPPISDIRERHLGGKSKSGFRPDIQGIRAIAVVLVLLCHAQLPFAEGGFIGVDVFYVLSGFLITGLIATEVERDGRVSIRGFYARRAKRLLPLAGTVLVFVAIVSLFVYGTARQVDVGGDIVAAALFVLNWRFIQQGTDYFAFESGMISPIQHYWTLAVEEQFYILWPLLLLAVGLFAIRFGRHLKRSMLMVIVPIAIASLVYGLSYTQSHPDSAFFSTFARGWELAFGAVLALTLPKTIKLPRLASTLLAVSGLVVIIGSAFVMKEADPFPGWRALLPVMATIALLVAGASTTSGPVGRLLSTSPFQYVGRISYSLYLWHWPFVVFAISIWGQLSPGWLVVATLASVIPAAISHKLIEEPFHLSKILALRPNRALALGAACIVTSVVGGLGLAHNNVDVDEISAESAKGAAVIRPGHFPVENRVTRIRPSPFKADRDKGQMFEDECLVMRSTVESGSCTYGDPDSDVTVVLLGDSHAMQYFPALDVIAEQKGWKLVGLTRADCTPADVDVEDHCDQWRENSMRRIAEEQPAMVVISTATAGQEDVTIEDGTKVTGDQRVPYLEDGLVRTIDDLQQMGAKVTLIGDQVKAPSLPHECVAENLNNLRACAFDNDPRPERAFDRGAARIAGIKMIDPVPMLCKKKICPAVIGNVLVYRDSYHLTATYSATLAPWLSGQLPKIR